MRVADRRMSCIVVGMSTMLGESTTWLLARVGPVLLVVGSAAGLDLVGMVEWTYPYCEDPADGPASAPSTR